MLLAQFARMEPTFNVPLVTQGFFYNRHQQIALILVQMGVGASQELILANLVMLLVGFVWAQLILNVPPVNQDISYNHHQIQNA